MHAADQRLDSEIHAAQFDQQGGLGFDLGPDDLPPEPLPHGQGRAGLGGKALGLGEVRGQRQHHAHGQIVAVAGDEHAARRGQPGKHGLGEGDLRMGDQDDGQVGQRHGDLGQVFALDDQLRNAHAEAGRRLREVENAVNHWPEGYFPRGQRPPSVLWP